MHITQAKISKSRSYAEYVTAETKAKTFFNRLCGDSASVAWVTVQANGRWTVVAFTRDMSLAYAIAAHGFFVTSVRD